MSDEPQVLLIGSGPLADAVADALSGVGVARHTDAFTERGSFELLLDADLVVDATGDEGTRYLINDAATIRGIPMVWADEGEVGVAWDERDADYRDLRPDAGSARPPGPADDAPPRSVIAARVAEAVRRLLAGDDDEVGQLASYGASYGASGVRVTGFHRDPDAPRPGSLEERTTIPEPEPDRSVTPAKLAQLLAGPTTAGIHETPPLLLDVREAPEASFVSLPDSVLIPLGQLPDRLDELAERAGGLDAPIVVYCHHGVRSARALDILQKAGFTRARHLTGGIDAWRTEVEPGMPAY